MKNAALKEGMLEVPEHVLVQCPKVGFAMARVSGCLDCKAFGGLEDRFPGSATPFTRRYTLKCFYDPVRRTMFEMAVGGTPVMKS